MANVLADERQLIRCRTDPQMEVAVLETVLDGTRQGHEYGHGIDRQAVRKVPGASRLGSGEQEGSVVVGLRAEVDRVSTVD